MKQAFYFVLFLSVIFLMYSCDSKSVEKDIIGTWHPVPKYHFRTEEYIEFKENGVFETKASRLFYLPLGFNSFDAGDTIPEKMSFNYQIDSIDEIGGAYYRIYSKDNNYSRRRYAVVDNNILFDCFIKPRPLDNNYINDPQVYIKGGENNKEIGADYFNQNIIFPDSLREGDYYIYYNKLSGKSNIKKENSDLVITHVGITELDKFLDIRYLALKRYKAYIKAEKDLKEIPVVYYNDFYDLDFFSKKDYIDKLCPNDDSKCLYVSRLNPGRYDFIREFGRGLKGGNVLNLTYISKKNLIKFFEGQYYGTRD